MCTMLLHNLCYLGSNQHWNWCLFCLFSLALNKMLVVLRLAYVLNGTALKQQFNKCNSIELICGKSQTNRDQKIELIIFTAT